MTAFTHTDDYGDSLTVENDGQGAAAVTTDHCNSVLVSRDDAPAVALAILEAAGWEPRRLGEGPLGDERVHVAASYLAEHARKADEEALDREALELLNAATESGYATMPDGVIASVWRRAARRARELHS
ncbi:hypothetical protein SEA_CASSIA_52 [Arthrobacter phage Cassia]|uniref:Uncharacterized protein n=1 Tax=Arthrobacter phage Cassia TaxID=2927275 RepID=A0AAF0GHC3_9CAUD|nr:hypothetical protein SEA_CASSIA_52 [Arthrobacter phage Cassia]